MLCAAKRSTGHLKVARAHARFVNVVFELDTPAHTLAWGRGRPDIMADCWQWMVQENPKVDEDSDDTMALDPTLPAARQLVSRLLAEVAALAPQSPWLHLGGDEVKAACWNASTGIRAHVTATYGNASATSYRLLQAEWTANVTAAAAVRVGKTPVVWQPTAAGPGDPAWDGALPPETVFMIWLNQASAKAYARAGSKVVITTPFYVAGRRWVPGSTRSAPRLPAHHPFSSSLTSRHAYSPRAPCLPPPFPHPVATNRYTMPTCSRPS